MTVFDIQFIVLIVSIALVFIQYISLLMDWIENLINNEDIFPVDKGTCAEL